MTHVPLPRTPHDELRGLLARARRRWRLRVALHGGAIVLGGALALVVVASWGMERGGYAPETILAFRMLSWVGIAALAVRFVVLPLLRRITDRRIALYLEEREPSLDATLVSAVEQDTPPAGAAHSPALAGKLVESALTRAREMQGARDPERSGIQRGSGIIAAIAFAGMALVLLGPSALRQGARLLALPWRSAEAATVYAIGVEPGDARLARGGDQEIRARLRGFTATDAELAVRRGAAGTWERIPMSPGADSGAFVARLFDVDEATQYFVESNGVRSPVHTLAVVDLPAVSRIDLEYRFPAYTGLAPRTEEDGGDIAAVRGTDVRVRVRSTRPVTEGRIIIEGEPPISLAVDSAGVLAGTLRVSRPGFYRVELRAVDGEMVRGSLDYAIDVLEDNAPTITFKTPGRDLKVHSLEEVFTEVIAEDDYGVASVELVFSVNGAPERSVVLHRGGRRARTEVAAGHTFYLEELSLSPGDVVSYHARARDGGPTGAAHISATDIYFLEVRPFEREYRQAEQRGMPGGGQGEGDTPGALSQRQRDIISATFKIVRDSGLLSTAERRDNLSTITLAQGTLRERVETLARRMAQRGLLNADSALRIIAEELPKAGAAMREAEELLGRRAASGALAPEQRALQHLQRAEAAYREVEVAFGSPSEGGGGSPQNPEELADLFELNRDKLRNQYESVQRGGRTEQGDRQVDEALEKLRALAARQQQENERALRRAEAGGQQSGGSGGGGSQRQVAQETEELARRLERLARERQSQELAETARRLQDAASAMRRSAASSRDAGAAEAAGALDRLQEARRLLDRERGSRLERDAQGALRAAEELSGRQREMARDVDRLRGGGPSAPMDTALLRQLTERKEALAADVEELESRLDRLSRDARRDQRETARGLQQAAGEIRERQIPDKVRHSRGVIRDFPAEHARSREEEIASDLEEVRRQVAEAVGAIGEREGKGTEEALARARELVRGLESLRERSGTGEGDRPAGGTPMPNGQSPGQVGGQGRGAAIGGGSALTPEQIRQLAREYRARRESAEALRRELSRQGVETEELRDLIGRLRALEGQGIYDDPEELARLQADVLERFKAFEFALRRRLEGAGEDGPVMGGASEVPAEFRKLVEEYYKSLARRRER